MSKDRKKLVKSVSVASNGIFVKFRKKGTFSEIFSSSAACRAAFVMVGRAERMELMSHRVSSASCFVKSVFPDGEFEGDVDLLKLN